MNFAFNFYDEISEIRQEIFSGDMSDLFEMFLAVAALMAAAALVKLGNDMTNGTRLTPVEILRPIIIGLVLCNYTTFVLLPLDGITSLVSRGVIAAYDNDTAVNKHRNMMKKALELGNKSEQSGLLTQLHSQIIDNYSSETVEDYSMTASEEDLAAADAEVETSRRSGWGVFEGLWDKIKFAVASSFHLVNVQVEGALVTVADVITNISGMIICGLSSFLLCILGLFGPLTISLSLLSGYHQSIWQWLAKYIQVSLWPPCVYFIQYLNRTLMDACANAYFGTAAGMTVALPTLTFLVICIISIAAIFSVPRVAGMIVPASTVDSLSQKMESRVSQGVSVAVKML